MKSTKSPFFFATAVALLAICAANVRSALALSAVIDASTNVVQLDNSTSGFNNAISLADSPGAVTIQASGNSIFGSNPGEQYNALAVQYRDANNRMQYGAVPNNGSNSFTGNHYDFGFLTDLAGFVPGNTGSTAVTELNASSTPIASGTIYAGSLSPATQTGVAQISATPGGNAAFFNVTTLQNYLVSASGQAFYDAAGDEYGSVVVQYRDAGNGISYAPLAIGTSQVFFGFNFRIFITDFAGQTADNSGLIFVDVNPVPEPSTIVLATAGFGGLIFWRQQRARGV